MFGKKSIKKIIRAGDLPALERALEEHPDWLDKDVSGFDSHGTNLLHFASECNQPDIITFLIKERGMDINQGDLSRGKFTPLHYAVSNAKEAVERLLELGADADRRSVFGHKPVDDAKKPEIKTLFRPDYRTINAVKSGDLQTLKAIIAKDPDTIYKPLKWDGDEYSGNVLHLAAFYDQPEVIEYLVKEKGMDVNNQNSRQRNTPLHYAALNDGEKSAAKLLKCGAKPALRNKEGMLATDLGKNIRLKKIFEKSSEKKSAATRRNAAHQKLRSLEKFFAVARRRVRQPAFARLSAR